MLSAFSSDFLFGCKEASVFVGRFRYTVDRFYHMKNKEYFGLGRGVQQIKDTFENGRQIWSGA
jgi:hypothetical protein